MTTKQNRLERMESESNELDYKLERLTSFIESDFYQRMKTHERDEAIRLRNQQAFMSNYLDVLLERISYARYWVENEDLND